MREEVFSAEALATMVSKDFLLQLEDDRRKHDWTESGSQ